MQVQKIFNTEAPNQSTRIIEGECSGILNWNDIRMPHMYKLYKVLLFNHWIADEIPMSKDAPQFAQLDRGRATYVSKSTSLCSRYLIPCRRCLLVT